MNLFGYIEALKSLSPIYFVKISLPDFLCKEFLIKMFRTRLLQKLQLRNLCPNYDNVYWMSINYFLLVGPYLQAIER